MSSEAERDPVCIETNGLALEIDVPSPAAALLPAAAQVIATAIGAANAVAGPVQGSVTVVIEDDERIRALNRQWRQIDQPTNVLSFPYPEAQPGPLRYIGDLAISYQTAAREAAAEGKSLNDHIAHLSVHGFLHLLGYDHESDAAAEEMEGLERVILARVGVADPYVASETQG